MAGAKIVFKSPDTPDLYAERREDGSVTLKQGDGGLENVQFVAVDKVSVAGLAEWLSGVAAPAKEPDTGKTFQSVDEVMDHYGVEQEPATDEAGEMRFTCNGCGWSFGTKEAKSEYGFLAPCPQCSCKSFNGRITVKIAQQRNDAPRVHDKP